MKKNVASQSIGAQMTTAADGTNFTSSVTVYYTIDNGTQTIGSVGSGVCTHEGNGYHSYAPTQGETNGDHIAWTFIGTGAISSTVQLFTQFPQTVDNDVLAAGSTGFSAIDTVVDSILVDTGTTLQAEVDAIQAAVITNAAGVDIAADIIALKAETALIVADTSELQTDNVPGLISTLDAVVDTVKAETALIVADTNELQTDDVPGLIAALDTVVDTVKAETALIVADTNELQVDWVNGGRLDNLLDGAASAGDPWTTALPGAYGAGTAGKIVGDNINAPIGTVDTVVDAIKAETALIVADTNELQTDDIPGLIAALDAVVDTVKAETALIVADTNELQVDDVPGLISTLDAVVDTVKAETALILTDTGTTIPATITTIDTEVGALQSDVTAIKAKTDPMQFTATNYLQTSVQYVVATNLQGAGVTGNEWRPV